MRTSPILADTAPAPLPSPDGASPAAAAKPEEFIQLLQQWGSCVRSGACTVAGSGINSGLNSGLNSGFHTNVSSELRSAVDPGRDFSEAEMPSGGSPEDVSASQDQAVLPRQPATAAGNHAPPGVSAAMRTISPTTMSPASLSATPGEAFHPTQKNLGTGKSVASNSGNHTKLSRVKKAPANQASSRPLLHYTAPIPGQVAEAVTAKILAGAQSASSVTGSTIGIAPEALPSPTAESSSQLARDFENRMAVGAGIAAAQFRGHTNAGDALAATADSSPEGATPIATSFAKSFATSFANQPNAKTAVSSAKSGQGAEVAVQSAPAEAMVEASSSLNHSLLHSAADASSLVAKSNLRDESAARGGGSSVAQAGASVHRDSSTGPVPTLHAQASSMQSAASQSATVQSTGGQSAAAISTAAVTAASAALPAPPQGHTLTSAPPQLQSNMAPGAAHGVDSGQLQMRGNNGELKISVQLPELGKVEVRAVTVHDVTTAHLTTFHHDALQVLAAGRSTLEQALKSRDVILGSFDSRAPNSNSQGQAGGEQPQQSSPSSAQSSGGTASTASAATPSNPAEAVMLPDYSSISVRV